ncbi:MAG: Maf family protein [Parcubacteria group bacterium]|jgi:septum formation protein
MKIILATTSPYRRKAFKELGLQFSVAESKAKENFPNRPNDPKKLVKMLARIKAEAVAKRYPNDFVIGCDSVGCFGGKIFEKPKSRKEEFERLKMLSGKIFSFYTGVCALKLDRKIILERVVETKEKMRKISDMEIKKYLGQDPNFNTYAMGFDPCKHYSSTFVKSINGSHNNFLLGFPMEDIMEMLFEMGYTL